MLLNHQNYDTKINEDSLRCAFINIFVINKWTEFKQNCTAKTIKMLKQLVLLILGNNVCACNYLFIVNMLKMKWTDFSILFKWKCKNYHNEMFLQRANLTSYKKKKKWHNDDPYQIFDWNVFATFDGLFRGRLSSNMAICCMAIAFSPSVAPVALFFEHRWIDLFL